MQERVQRTDQGFLISPVVDWAPDVGKEILPPEIFYGAGDATVPMHDGKVIIAHVCNDIGVWGKGFVLPLSLRYPEAEKQFREWYKRKTDPLFALGQVQFVEVAPHVWVANMIRQSGIYPRGGVQPIRYEELRECLAQVRSFAHEHGADVQMPRIGCGLAGGDWETVSKIIEEELAFQGVMVTVRDLLATKPTH